MILDLLAKLIIEFIRALLIDELSEHVRARVTKARRNRRIKFDLRLQAGKPHRLVRTLSTEDWETVE